MTIDVRQWATATLATAALALGCSSSDDGEASDDTGASANTDVSDDAAVGNAPRRQNVFYVANTESESISVVDHETMDLATTIALGNKPHGQAPTSDGERIYATTDGGHGEVIAIDTSSNSIEWRIDVGSEMNEPHLTRDDRFLYAPDLLGARVVVVDVDLGEAVDEIAMVDDAGNDLVALHNTYASHDGEHIYVTAILSQTIAEIDPKTNEITRLFGLSGDPRPAAITEDDRKMYVQLSDLHGFIELDLETGEETRQVTWDDPANPAEGYGEEGGLPTKCHGIGISPDGSEVWAATNMEGAVYVYSLPDLEQIGRVDVGNWPNWIAFSSDGSTVYVTNSELFSDTGTVSVIDRAEQSVVKTIDVGKTPKRIHRVELPER